MAGLNISFLQPSVLHPDPMNREGVEQFISKEHTGDGMRRQILQLSSDVEPFCLVNFTPRGAAFDRCVGKIRNGLAETFRKRPFSRSGFQQIERGSTEYLLPILEDQPEQPAQSGAG